MSAKYEKWVVVMTMIPLMTVPRPCFDQVLPSSDEYISMVVPSGRLVLTTILTGVLNWRFEVGLPTWMKIVESVCLRITGAAIVPSHAFVPETVVLAGIWSAIDESLFGWRVIVPTSDVRVVVFVF